MFPLGGALDGRGVVSLGASGITADPSTLEPVKNRNTDLYNFLRGEVISSFYAFTLVGPSYYP